jgi:Tfp pilus assembly protein PilF
LIEACRVMVGLARESHLASRCSETEDVLNAALRRDPTAVDLLMMLATLNHIQERYGDAVRNFRAALALDPGNLSIRNNLAWTLSEGLHQPSEAWQYIGELDKLTRRDNPLYLDTRGVVLMRLGRLDEAISDLERACRSDPSGIIHYHLALAYQKANRPEGFRRSMEDARKAGLTSSKADPTERKELESILKH